VNSAWPGPHMGQGLEEPTCGRDAARRSNVVRRRDLLIWKKTGKEPQGYRRFAGRANGIVGDFRGPRSHDAPDKKGIRAPGAIIPARRGTGGWSAYIR
jgi:hypothetical protein